MCLVRLLQGDKKHYWDNKKNRGLKNKFALFILGSRPGEKMHLELRNKVEENKSKSWNGQNWRHKLDINIFSFQTDGTFLLDVKLCNSHLVSISFLIPYAKMKTGKNLNQSW